MTRESIKSKIAALLAKAEGTDNEFEAATFMAKVNELLEKHQIDMHEIRSHSAREEDPMGRERGETNIYASMLWARNLAGAVARYYGCQFVYWKKRNHFTYDIVGRESARTTFELMLPFIITQIKLQAKRIDSGSFNKVSRSVLERQVGQATEVRVWKLVGAAEQRRAEITGKGLVPVDDLAAAMDAFYPDVKKAKQKKPYRYSREAHDAAQRVSLHHQATGRHTKLIES